MSRKTFLSEQDALLLKKLEKRVGGRAKLERLANGLSFVVERGIFEQAYAQSLRMPKVERFCVPEEFRVRDDGITIAHVGDRFLRRFGNIVEEQIAHDYVRMLELQKSTRARYMMPYFGGEMGAPLPLAHVFWFLKRANRGKNDYLFFVPDKSGTLCSVRADRYLQGWWIDVVGLASEHVLFEKGRVVVVRDEPLPLAA